MAARKGSALGSPKDVLLRHLCERIMVGIASAATHAYRSTGVPMIRNTNIKEGHIEVDELIYLDPGFEQQHRNKRLKAKEREAIAQARPHAAAVDWSKAASSVF